MNALVKLALGAAIAGSAAFVVSPSFSASETVRATPPRGAEARPCRYFVHRHLPAPHHCYRYFSNMFGPDVYVHGGLVFRDREAFLGWHERHEMGPARLTEREDRYAARDHERHMARAEEREDRYAERDHDRYGPPPEEREDRYAQREEGPPPYAEENEEMSGGAGAGPGRVHEGSGGATRGERAEQSVSGGASRGEHVEQHASGGASGY